MLLNVSRFISTLTCLCYTWVSSMSLVCSESMMSMSSCNEVLTSFNWTLDWKPSHFVTARTKYYLKHDLEEFSQLDRHARGNVCLFVLTKLILDILYPNCQVAASRFKESFLLKYSCCLSSTGDDFFPPILSQLILLLAVFSTVLNVLSEPLQSVLIVAAKSNSSIWHHLCKDHWLKKHKTDIYFC